MNQQSDNSMESHAKGKVEKETAVPHIILKPSHGWISLQLDRVWQYRELLYFLVWRDIKVRYKQSVLGILWIAIQPVMTMVVFTFLFGNLLAVPTGGIPYPIFVYSALLPWQYFANSLTRSSTNLVDNSQLITKVYFPRLIIPFSGVFSGLVDFFVAFIVLILLMATYKIQPTYAIIYLPAFLLLAMITALGFGLWLSALNVRFRDIKHLVPFIVQLWMYLTPVIYSSLMIPEQFRFLLALNPMTGVVAGFRWALLGNAFGDAGPPGDLFPISILIALLVFVSGMIYFRYTERTFADII